MGCSLDDRAATQLVIEYVAGTLDLAEATKFEAHLETCAGCRALTAEQQAVWATLSAWKPIAVSPDFDQKLFQRIAHEQQLGWWRRLSFPNLSWGPMLPVAAASALLVLAFLLKEPHFLSGSPAGQREPGIEQQVQRALDDMEMLTQIGGDVAAGDHASPAKI